MTERNTGSVSELPEVESVRRGLPAILSGKRIEAITLLCPSATDVSPAAIDAPVVGGLPVLEGYTYSHEGLYKHPWSGRAVLSRPDQTPTPAALALDDDEAPVDGPVAKHAGRRTVFRHGRDHHRRQCDLRRAGA